MTSPAPDLLTAALKARDELVQRLRERVVHDPFDDRIKRSDSLCLEAAQAIIDMAGRISELEKECDELKENLEKAYRDLPPNERPVSFELSKDFFEAELDHCRDERDTAFTRGYEAAREDAAKCAETTPIAGMKSKTDVPCKIAAAILSLPLPEDGRETKRPRR